MGVVRVPKIPVGAARSANSNHDNSCERQPPGTFTLTNNSVKRNQAYPYLPRGMGGSGAKLDLNRTPKKILSPCKAFECPNSHIRLLTSIVSSLSLPTCKLHLATLKSKPLIDQDSSQAAQATAVDDGHLSCVHNYCNSGQQQK